MGSRSVLGVLLGPFLGLLVELRLGPEVLLARLVVERVARVEERGFNVNLTLQRLNDVRQGLAGGPPGRASTGIDLAHEVRIQEIEANVQLAWGDGRIDVRVPNQRVAIRIWRVEGIIIRHLQLEQEFAALVRRPFAASNG